MKGMVVCSWAMRDFEAFSYFEEALEGIVTTSFQAKGSQPTLFLNTIALRKAKIVYNFGLSECNRVKYPRPTAYF